MKSIKTVIFALIFLCVCSILFALSFRRGGVVVVKDATIYSEPNVDSRIIGPLNITEVVLIESNAMVTNADGAKEEWLFIDTMGQNLEGQQIKGWIQKRTVAEPKDFKSVKKFGDYYLEFWSGDSHFAYRFYKNGTYKEAVFEEIENIGSGDKIERFRKGKLYRYKNIVATDIGAIFLLDEEVIYLLMLCS